MSRVHDGGHAAPSISGEVALPLPTGDGEGLRAAARSLDRAAARAQATTTVCGTLAARLGSVWSGAAADAARVEADELGSRSRPVVGALPRTAHALVTYAAALDHATGRVRALQREWDALDADHALATLRLSHLPDPTGAGVVLGLERARADLAAGRARLSRTHAAVLEELRASARRCTATVAALTDMTFPSGSTPTPGLVRSVVTGGLSFADGVVAQRRSREAALSDGLLVRRAVAAAQAGGGRLTDGATAVLVTRIRERRDDPAYAQALLEELGTDGLADLLLTAGVTHEGSGAHVDTVRGLLGTLGSLVITATGRVVPAGTDPRTRAELASGAALLADDVVAGVDTVRTAPSGDGRATGAWLLGQLLSGARADGDVRRLPPRLARRAAAAAATSEIAETRDADPTLRHGSTLVPDASSTFASWFEDAATTGDALHVLLGHVRDDPAEAAALLAEPLPDSGVAGLALANSRGDRLTLGEHLVRRWITHEASGTESHPDLHLHTDDDLRQLLGDLAFVDGDGAAQTRARVMLEVSRTSAFAMSEASTTRIYTAATAPVEGLVADWVAAMRENVDRALASPGALSTMAAPYTAVTTDGPQPWLTPRELTGVVGALAVDTGMGLRAKQTGAAYDRLVDRELDAARETVATGGDPQADEVRLGFLDQSASATLVALARRQDDLNRSAWQGIAEAVHVIDIVKRGDLPGLTAAVHTYLDGGTLRTPADDLVISLVRSNVELSQTEVDEARRSELVSRVEAITGGGRDVLPALSGGAALAPGLPSAEALRAIRADEIRASAEAAAQDGTAGLGSRVSERLGQRTTLPDRVHVVEGSGSSPRSKVGSVDLGAAKDLKDHEKATASRLAALGHDVEFLSATGHGKSPDALVDGVLWEFKSPTGASSETIARNLRKGSEQSPRIVIDLARCDITVAEAVGQAEYALDRYDRIEAILIIDKDGRTTERTR
ncbi:hypothetical protein GCM10009868_13220 [Terrabacter aerolatus]|uniref:tRNA nuclease CdiA C-terminal domain-containing protein n=1 Tax=Terrabacter aerolatus TaxID=422442 RepID=A0A512CY88_9MICO|nr:hypothetical protein [Terrabacter aerolatus]GEO29178.1 hypothetical protein TAE01_09880 [Terrabacter aerolatus]